MIRTQTARRDETGAVKVVRLIRHLLFLTCVIGALLALDAVGSEGKYRTTAWRDAGFVWRDIGWSVWRAATYQGRAFSVTVERSLGKSLW